MNERNGGVFKTDGMSARYSPKPSLCIRCSTHITRRVSWAIENLQLWTVPCGSTGRRRSIQYLGAASEMNLLLF